MVIVYRVSPLTYAIGKRVVTLPHYGMVNLVSGRAIVTELIQDDCTPERVCDETRMLLTDQARASVMRNDLTEVVRRLGGAGASERAADAVLSTAHTRGTNHVAN